MIAHLESNGHRMTYTASATSHDGSAVAMTKPISKRGSAEDADLPSSSTSGVSGTDESTMTERAYRQLEELIVTLQLPPGTILSEQMLAHRLEIGRTPIREALQRLALDGLVTILPRRGILVSEINLRTQLRLLEVRR